MFRILERNQTSSNTISCSTCSFEMRASWQFIYRVESSGCTIPNIPLEMNSASRRRRFVADNEVYMVSESNEFFYVFSCVVVNCKAPASVSWVRHLWFVLLFIQRSDCLVLQGDWWTERLYKQDLFKWFIISLQAPVAITSAIEADPLVSIKNVSAGNASVFLCMTVFTIGSWVIFERNYLSRRRSILLVAIKFLGVYSNNRNNQNENLTGKKMLLKI